MTCEKKAGGKYAYRHLCTLHGKKTSQIYGKIAAVALFLLGSRRQERVVDCTHFIRDLLNPIRTEIKVYCVETAAYLKRYVETLLVLGGGVRG